MRMLVRAKASVPCLQIMLHKHNQASTATDTMEGTPLYAMHNDEWVDDGTARTAAPELPAQQITGMNFANFNQDYSCISVGYSNGFRIYNCDPFTQCYERVDGSIGIVEMLFCSSLLAIVGTGEQPAMSPRRLKIINTKRQTTICELTFPTSILSIRMNRERLVVLLEERIYVYDINNMKLLHTIEIPSNPTGLIALSTDTENNFLAYPSPQRVTKINENGSNSLGMDVTALNSQQMTMPNNNSAVNNSKSNDDINGLVIDGQTQSVRNGDVVIFDCKLLQPITVIDAHKTQLAAIAFSQDGTLLATASDKGTIIRVFSVQTGLKLYQFRRGSYNTRIYSLAFGSSNMFLTASSATGTIHVFRLGQQEANNTVLKPNGSSGWLNHKKSANDKNIEASRQEELDKMMKNRQSKLESIDLDIVDESEENALLDKHLKNNGIESPDLLKLAELNVHSDSEDDVESLLDIEEEDRGEVEDEEVEDEEQSHIETNPGLHNDLHGSSSLFSTSSDPRTQPVVDNNRRSVARMLRRTSQKLGRKAAEKMGTYLPPKFSSILEPNRHFASLKVPSTKETMTIVGITESTQDLSDLTEDASINSHLTATLQNDETESTHSVNSMSASVVSKLRRLVVTIQVVSAEGIFYTYRLDPERGGDCVLISQRSLFE